VPSKLAESWQQAASDMGLEIVSPFRLQMPDNREIEFEVLLKNFGAKNGMLLVSNYSKIEKVMSIILEMGYGCSVLSPSLESYRYSREDYEDVLADWGWSGPAADEPTWLKKFSGEN
jgi:hypothetical protein